MKQNLGSEKGLKTWITVLYNAGVTCTLFTAEQESRGLSRCGMKKMEMTMLQDQKWCRQKSTTNMPQRSSMLNSQT